GAGSPEPGMVRHAHVLPDRNVLGGGAEATAGLGRPLGPPSASGCRQASGTRRDARRCHREARGSVAAMPPVLAAYHGPPEVTLSTAFSQWVLAPWALAAVLVLGAAYLAGVRRARRAGQDWPAGRIVAFCGFGLGFAVLATMSFLGAYQDVLF